MARKDQLQEDMQFRRQQIDAGLAASMETTEGRALLGWMIFDLDAGRLDRISFTQDVSGAAAPLHTAYFEGRRAVGAALRDRIIKINPDAWLLLQGERMAEDRMAASLAREAAKREGASQGNEFDDRED